MKALLKSASDAGTPLSVLQAVEDINQEQRKRFFGRMERHFGGKLEGLRFAVWGIAFKPNTDDTREAPVFHIIDELLNGKASVVVFDPEAMGGARARYGDRIEYAESSYGALQGADALVIATEWFEFRKPDFGLMKTLMRQPVIFDGRNIYDPRKMREPRLGLPLDRAGGARGPDGLDPAPATRGTGTARPCPPSDAGPGCRSLEDQSMRQVRRRS